MAFTTNTGKSVFATIESIAATSSKLEKEALMKNAGSSTLFMRSIIAAYDPFKNYGISNAPHKTSGMAPGSNDLNEDWIWKVLTDLSTRALSGNAARDKVQQVVDFLDEPSAEMFRRIVNKDMRAGFTDGTINRVFKGTIAEFPYMRCSLPAKSNMGKWDWSTGIITQEKADGMFANVNIGADGKTYITSRAGSPFPAGSLQIEEDIEKTFPVSTQTHGELTVFEAGVLLPREKGNGILNSLLSGGALEVDQKVVFDAWDQIPLKEVVSGGKFATPYKQRLAALIRQTTAAQRIGIASVRLIPTRVVRSKADAYAHYRELLKLGKEGVICKHPDAIWKDTTSKDQVKLKLEVDVDLRVVDFVPAAPGTKYESMFGSLLCRSEDGLLEVAVSGFTEAKRQSIHNDRDRWLHSIIAVRANSIMSPDEEYLPYSLFLPRYVEDREDKKVADDLQRIKDQFEAATEGV